VSHSHPLPIFGYSPILCTPKLIPLCWGHRQPTHSMASPAWSGASTHGHQGSGPKNTPTVSSVRIHVGAESSLQLA
jgi:hypothetical protein